MRATLALVLGCAGMTIAATARECPREDAARRPAAAVVGRAAALAVPFVENVGQSAAEIRFTADTFAGAVHVTSGGDLVYAPRQGGRRGRRGGVVLRERLCGGPEATVSGSESSPTRVNVYRGSDPRRWRSGVPTWTSVTIAHPGDGVVLEVRASSNNVEKLFRVDAGADPQAIRVAVDGAESLRVGTAGELEVATSEGTLRFTAPLAYQERDGGRTAVDAAYAVHGAQYGFVVGPRDPSRPLVIDPLIASTWLGSGAEEWGEDIDVYWHTGEVYVTGPTGSGAFAPSGVGSGVEFHGGTSDAFVACLSPDLTTLLAFTLVGGAGDDTGLGVCVESRGVWVVGETTSTDLPATPGVWGPVHHGGTTDGFVAKLTRDALVLEACTYHGGSGADRLTAIDGPSGLRFAGETSSPDLFVGEHAIQKSLAGGQDLLFAYTDEELTRLWFQTYLGGSGTESVSQIITGEGTVVAAGWTTSADFPTTPGAWRRTRSGDRDGIVVHIMEGGSALVGSTYVGGTSAGADDEAATGVAWSALGGICVSGWTNAADFPTTEGAYDRTFSAGGGTDAFVAAFDWELTQLAGATYLGGGGADRALDIASDTDGIYVAGDTASADLPALTSTIDATYGGGGDVFVARFSPDLSALTGSTFLGGHWPDSATAVCLHGGVLYVTGSTIGWEYPTTPGAFDSTYDASGPGSEGFVTSLTLELSPAPAETDSFILPRTLNAVRRTPAEKSRLGAAGTFDAGAAAADLSGPATLTVGGTDFDFPDLFRNRRGVLRYKASGVDLRITPSRFGSSRGAFTLKVTGASAAAVDPDAPLEIRFRSGDVDGRGIVVLTEGRYKLGRRRGALVAPPVFPYNCVAKLKGSSRDTLSLRLGLASGGATPDVAPAFSLRVGDAFDRSVPSDAFVRRGDRYVFRGPKGALTAVTLDYARERILATAAAVDAGAYEQGSQPVRIVVQLGDAPEQAVLVRMACKGRTLRY